MRIKANDVIIDVNNVYKNFRVYFDKGSMLKEQFINPGRSRYEEREILKGISFKVYRGETVALIGQNGCGKSTTLKMLTKILYPNRGTVTVNGKVSSLIELGAGFHPDMSGRENIYINASILGIKKEEVDRRIDEIIRFSELEEFIDNPIRTYSSGMYMRLAFSVAINVDADVLLIDEILAVGDKAFQEKCIRKLDELRASGTTVVIVSHSMSQIKEIADRCIWIENGQIREDGDVQEVCDHYEKAMTRRREERDEFEEEVRKEENLEEQIENKSAFEEFRSKLKGEGTQGKPLMCVSMIALMILLAVSSDVFMIDIKQDAAEIVPVINTSIITKVIGYVFFILGRASVPMLLILLGFELLPADYSSRGNRINYYKGIFWPVLITWEMWVIIYQVFLYLWSGRMFDLKIWIKEALLIKYIDLSHGWIFRFILLFMLITPYVAIIIQKFSVGLLRFLMILVWVLIFLFPGLDYYGQANGGVASFPQSLGTFCYFFYFCLGYLISRYMQRILKGSNEVALWVLAFVITVWTQIFLDARDVDYLIKPTYFGISIMALFGFDLLFRLKIKDMYPKLAGIFENTYKCVRGMYFVYVPIQLVLTRYVFKVWKAQESGDVFKLTGICLGMWVAIFIISFALVYLVRLARKVFIKLRVKNLF